MLLVSWLVSWPVSKKIITQCDIRRRQLHNINLITNKIYTLCTQQKTAFPCKCKLKPDLSDDPNWYEHIDLCTHLGCPNRPTSTNARYFTPSTLMSCQRLAMKPAALSGSWVVHHSLSRMWRSLLLPGWQHLHRYWRSLGTLLMFVNIRYDKNRQGSCGDPMLEMITRSCLIIWATSMQYLQASWQ